MKIQDLISDESKWTKGALALKAGGETCEPKDQQACCWCLYGMIMRCYKEDDAEKIKERIRQEIKQACITMWNDEHSYQDVLDLVKKLDI